MDIHFKGYGVLAPGIILGTFLLIVFIAARIIPGDDPVPSDVVRVAWAVSAMANWSAGAVLNRRGWNHTLYGIPMQFWSVVPVVILVLLIISDK